MEERKWGVTPKRRRYDVTERAGITSTLPAILNCISHGYLQSFQANPKTVP
jgi:hypothetical protein